MVVVSCRNGKVVGYVSGTSLAAKAHVAIIQTMLRTFPPPPDCYLYGPVCRLRPRCSARTFRGLRSDLLRRLRQRISHYTGLVTRRVCNGRGTSPGVQFSRDLLDRL